MIRFSSRKYLRNVDLLVLVNYQNIHHVSKVYCYFPGNKVAVPQDLDLKLHYILHKITVSSCHLTENVLPSGQCETGNTWSTSCKQSRSYLQFHANNILTVTGNLYPVLSVYYISDTIFNAVVYKQYSEHIFQTRKSASNSNKRALVFYKTDKQNIHVTINSAFILCHCDLDHLNR